jgi:hypothetical protein
MILFIKVKKLNIPFPVTELYMIVILEDFHDPSIQ